MITRKYCLKCHDTVRRSFILKTSVVPCFYFISVIF
uniref:Uncharacterized protein n=1 Tax=Anguilla anguilla TaxID=7936 RepID=A0A0E9VN94_ANGAN